MINQKKPDNYMVWAILSTLFCCLPLGIVSIINASKVDGLYAAGAYGEAQAASENAKKWALWATISGVISYILVILFYAIIFFIALAAE